MKSVFIVAKPDKPHVAAALEELRPWLSARARIAGIETDPNRDLSHVEADFILVLGGDGTLLSTARRLQGAQVPLMGVNFGRLGFLSSFTPQNYKQFLERQLTIGDLPVEPRQMLQASVLPLGATCRGTDGRGVERQRRFCATALNDAVVTAGPPFRMIELELASDDEAGVRYFGDGVIVSTASGSTAYNVSAGGPIISPEINAFCITPICPHSLSFRPMVVSSDSTVLIAASRVNEGTTLFCDGQASTKLCAGERVVVRRNEKNALLLENPENRQWHSLAEKLHWAVSPTYQG